MTKNDDLIELLQEATKATDDASHLRFHVPHLHLGSVFGDDWFALKAEAFTRFFGTPTFLITQTLCAFVWMGANALGYARFDVYPFVFLNLILGFQAAYAAPLILLAQTRQADRDKANSDADARHREDIAVANAERQTFAVQQNEQIMVLLDANTKLTELTKDISEQLKTLTEEVHCKLISSKYESGEVVFTEVLPSESPDKYDFPKLNIET